MKPFYIKAAAGLALTASLLSSSVTPALASDSEKAAEAVLPILHGPKISMYKLIPGRKYLMTYDNPRLVEIEIIKVWEAPQWYGGTKRSVYVYEPNWYFGFPWATFECDDHTFYETA